MSRCLRYQNPIVYEHLASQYVAGNLTARVRQRIETLSKTVPELDREIAAWADSFSELHQQIPSPTLEAGRIGEIWAIVDEQTPLKPIQPAQQYSGVAFFRKLFVWKMATAIGALASLMMAIMLWGDSLAPSVSGPSYLANMSVHNDPKNAIQFVISAYAKSDDRPSRLHVQWTKNKTATSFANLHLWAEDKETGELSYIGLKPKEGEAWDLTKSSWQAIANSRRLIMTKDKTITDDNTVFSGACLQLKEWTV